MANVDRAFRVIVLGGIALSAVPASACGGQTSSSSSDAGSGADAADSGFPQEGPAYVDSSFPMETATQLDSGVVQPDAFPTEGPAMILDSGTAEAAGDSAVGDAGFPQETAQAADP